MGKKKKNNFYAFDNGAERGIVSSWPECERKVSGRKAKYKGFVDRASAQAWLASGGTSAKGTGRKKLYAYSTDQGQGIVDSWAACENAVEGRKARYRGFATRAEAQAWLAAGAPYQDKKQSKSEALDKLPAEAIFFDSGTGAGRGTEIRVTDRDKTPILHLAGELPGELTVEGNLVLGRGKTNNYGELLACRLALKVAEKMGAKHVFGDSKLVLEYWSKNRISKEKRATDPAMVELAKETAQARVLFEKQGGTLAHVSGGINPADLGFHRD